MFIDLLCSCQELPNKFTFPFVIKAAGAASDEKFGRAVHGMLVKMKLGSDLYILNSLIHFYASCGCLDVAYKVFLSISGKDVVSWNSIITSFSQRGRPEEALELFQQMLGQNVEPNELTMVGALSACAEKGDLETARYLLSYIENKKINLGLTLSNAVLDMYMKCGRMADAKSFFDGMVERDEFSWTTMVAGYAKAGDYAEAWRILDDIPYQDIAVWNALISAYVQNGKPKEALELFYDLQARKDMKPDQVTLVGALSACAQIGAVDLGGWIHIYMKKQGVKLNCHLITSLIDMYSKSGDIDKAVEVFHSAEKRDVFVWSSMIAGFAMHGQGKAALDLFLKMLKAKVKPNEVTFTNILAACSHNGLVEEGRKIFNQMESSYGIIPGLNHYACMVDILGRAGSLEEALQVIKKMPMSPNASVWKALLGASRIHSNLDLAEMAFHELVELEPSHHGAYVLMSNVYAKLGNWEKVSGLRKLMKELRLKKEPGCSCIEVNGTVHEFFVADNSHPLSLKIYSKLDEVVSGLKSEGYEPNKSHLLQFVEEEETKEQALYLHSEKIAIAFGLISLEPSQPIRVVKNLRVCGDCHSFAKIVSKVYNREVFLRDRYRFHHFKEGCCSCMDFW